MSIQLLEEMFDTKFNGKRPDFRIPEAFFTARCWLDRSDYRFDLDIDKRYTPFDSLYFDPNYRPFFPFDQNGKVPTEEFDRIEKQQPEKWQF